MDPSNRNGGRTLDKSDSEDGSLTRLAQEKAIPTDYKVPDGEFSSFPEITSKTQADLISRGIKNLFPIQ